jgi:uncharacterized damage-inducible protein DinB
MREAVRIADQLKRAFYGDAWHGPAVMEALEGVDATTAGKRPIEGAHTIWELVDHIAAWLDIVRRRLNGEEFDVTQEMDWQPASRTGESAWRESLARMKQAESALRTAVLQIPDSRLEEPATEGARPVYILLDGAIQHSVYHAGQIVLLKRAFQHSRL